MTYQTFNISLPRDLVTAMDELARRDFRTRSDLIREAVWAYVVDMAQWNSLFAYGKTRAKAKNIRNDRDVTRLVSAYRRGK